MNPSMMEKIKPRIKKLLGITPPKFVPPTDGKTRLNLGCGDKLLEGYINVDVVESRKGEVPDIMCDIKKLDSIENEYADEILAVHVIEHFYYWEVFDLLKEWKKKLKPGGKLVLECPNILYAAKMLIKNQERVTGPGTEGKTTMWVLYGDPSWKDPLMCHRWGFTPRSLGQVLEEVGFIDIKQEKALFKAREPRDMRITGIKPLES
jgi:SAM-dependent methyltransferase